MLPADVEIPTKGLDTDEQIDAFDAKYGIRTEDMIKAAGDDRAMLYSGVGGGRRKIQTDAISGFTDGLSIVKWQNYRSDGKPVSHATYPDTDIPLFRLAEAYRHVRKLSSVREEMQRQTSTNFANVPTVQERYRL